MKSLWDEIDDMMSDIWEYPEGLKDLKIPERIKKESKIMEKILNFTLLGFDDFGLRDEIIFISGYSKRMS